MKKQLIWLSAAIWVFNCTAVGQVHANEQATSAPDLAQLPQERIRISTRTPLVGLWGMTIPNNKKCVEYYNFNSKNEVYVHSDQEWSSGQYEYQVANERSEQLSALILQIKYDNDEVDCSGNKVDQSGEISQYFVKWHNPNQIEFCASNDGQHCFATLRRVLP